ncbi:MAG: hypothetical protein WBG86_13475, partial [Polyangiales bacterium]
MDSQAFRESASRPGSLRSVELGGSFALLVLLVVSPQLLGGVFPWSIAIICATAAATGLLTSRQLSTTSQRATPARLLDWAMVTAWVWTALQLVPLPQSLESLLVPESVDAWRA